MLKTANKNKEKKFMSKCVLLIGFLLLLSSCAKNQIKSENKIIKKNDRTTYQEIETILTEKDQDNNKKISSERKKLENENFFLHKNNSLITFPELEEIKPEIKCQKTKVDCEITNIEYPKNFSLNWSSHYILDKTQYDIFLNKEYEHKLSNAEYCIFKDKNKIFCSLMNTGSVNPILDARSIMGSPAFTFLVEKKDGKQATNIFFNNELINEKYNIKSSKELFVFKEKIGFIGEENNKSFIFFNGKKISDDFDEIRTGVSAMSNYIFELYDNGILFFMARRGEKYFFVEIDINEYL